VRKVQRLFGNAYGPTDRQLTRGGPRPVAPAGAKTSVMTPYARWLLLAAVVVAASTVFSAAGASLSGPSVAPGSHFALHADSTGLNGSPTGQILFGAPLPVAEILPTANGSPAATLALNHLLEIGPNASDPEHPTVVAEAAPETLATFNETPPTSETLKYLNLIATLPVYPADSPLWVAGTSIPSVSGVAKQAILDVNYSVATGSDKSPGVLVSWTVSGWPWVNPSGDELALEYVVQVTSGSGFETCTGAPSTYAPDARCATEQLALGQAVWSSSLTALKGNGPSGSVAWISWSSQVTASNTKAAPESAGAYFEQPGTSALAIAAPDGGAASVSGSTLFLLSPGAASSAIIGALAGNLPAYGGAAVVFAVGACVGVVLSRRRDRSIARELSE
jgi:hypothetical protein